MVGTDHAGALKTFQKWRPSRAIYRLHGHYRPCSYLNFYRFACMVGTDFFFITVKGEALQRRAGVGGQVKKI